MSVQDPELSAETPYSEHFMAPAAGDPTAVLAELKAIRRQTERDSAQTRIITVVLNGQTDAAAGYLTMAAPITPEGYRDHVVNVVAGGLYMGQTAQGTIALFVASSLPVIDLPVPTSLVRAYNATMPYVWTFNMEQLVVHQGAFFGFQVFDTAKNQSQYVVNYTFYREPLTVRATADQSGRAI
jgi:hypothetical protein